MAGYLPLTDGELNNWARNFAARIAAAPEAHGLSGEQVTAILSAVESYSAAYACTAKRQTRTQVQVAAKNTARKQVLRVLRRFAQLIKANPEVSNRLKIDAGIALDSPTRTRIAPPASRPLVQILHSTPRRHQLFLADAENPEHPGKPRHVIGLQLFCHVGDVPPADPQDARFERFVTRQLHTVDFKPQQIGQKAFYYARWMIATGETGPWSAVASMTVAG